MNNLFSKYCDRELYQLMLDGGTHAEYAFAEIYSRYSHRVYAYCLRVIGNPEDARDLFQDTFFKFYNSKQSTFEVDNIPAFLLRIARNSCLNFKRNKKTTFNFDDYNFSTNDQGYEQRELLQIIARALECLEFEYREVFVLRQYHNLSYNEIAEITGDTISNIRNKVWRAKEKIKNILEPILEDLSK